MEQQEINCETAMVVAPEAKQERTKLVMVKQGYIDCLLRERAVLPPRRAYPCLSDEAIDRVYKLPEKREHIRRLRAETAALLKKMQDEDEDDDILHQFHTKGFAVQEIEIRDDDGDNEG